jgi:hypothetical protein
LSAYADKLATVDLNSKSKSNRFLGVANARIHQHVQKLMQKGEQLINQRILTKETNSNLKAIKTYLQQHQAEIDAYNQSLADGTSQTPKNSTPPIQPQPDNQIVPKCSVF